jgi:hypothetical protein
MGQNRLRTGSVARFRACEVTAGCGEIVKFQNESKEFVVSQIFTSWNQLDGWLRLVDGLRPAVPPASH